MRSNCANCALLLRILSAYRRLVRVEVRTSGSHPLTRTWCEPGRQPVIKSCGCQALVSTVVSRVLQWFPLATWPGPNQTHGTSSTGRRARSAPALSVEFNSPCRSQHAGADYYFDHTLTECETGIRPKPRRVGVWGLSRGQPVKQAHRGRWYPWQTPDGYGAFGPPTFTWPLPNRWRMWDRHETDSAGVAAW